MSKRVGLGSLALVTSLSLAACTTSAPPPATVAATIQQIGYQRIALTKLATGHETLLVEINGKVGRFILDSGASASVIHHERAAGYGIETPPDAVEMTASGAGGSLALWSHPLSSLRLENVALGVDRIFVGDLSHIVAAFAALGVEDIDGVIGQDILGRYDGIIDIGGQALFVRDQAPSPAPAEY